MSDWTALSQDNNQVTIGPWSPESIGGELVGWLITAASAAWPTANRAIYIPFVVQTPITVVKIGVLNGATASGNMDAGIYDDTQNRIVSIGSTAQSGTSAVQTLDIADTALDPGVYYMALCMDGTTGTTSSVAASIAVASSAGVLSQAVGAVTLPATAAFAAAADAYIPFFYLTARTLI